MQLTWNAIYRLCRYADGYVAANVNSSTGFAPWGFTSLTVTLQPCTPGLRAISTARIMLDWRAGTSGRPCQDLCSRQERSPCGGDSGVASLVTTSGLASHAPRLPSNRVQTWPTRRSRIVLCPSSASTRRLGKVLSAKSLKACEKVALLVDRRALAPAAQATQRPVRCTDRRLGCSRRGLS